jgi:hypothetical protein
VNYDSTYEIGFMKHFCVGDLLVECLQAGGTSEVHFASCRLTCIYKTDVVSPAIPESYSKTSVDMKFFKQLM